MKNETPGDQGSDDGDRDDPLDQEIWDLLEEMNPPASMSAVPDARLLLAGWSKLEEPQWAAAAGPDEAVGPGPSARTGTPARMRRWRVPLAVAAAVVLLAGVWLGRALRQPWDGGSGQGVEFAGLAGDPAPIQLPDGTWVYLEEGSRLRFTQGAGVREGWLEGRAFFAVAHDSARPFSVTGPAGEAAALGTRFSLESDGKALRVVVVDGRVALASGAERVEVGPGQWSGTRGGGVTPPTEVSDLQAALRWMGRTLVFQATPLDAVARELSARYGITVELLDPVLSHRTVTAWFGDEDPADVLIALCVAVKARCTYAEGRATMAP